MVDPSESRDPALPAVVDATVDALCELQRQRTIAFSVDVGRIVVEGIYGGDLHRLRERHAKDCPTLRTLAAHPRMPFSATALHQAIGIYLLATRLPGVFDSDLTLTHLRAVLPYPDEVQDHLLTCAIVESWSARELEHEARVWTPAGGKGGRPRLPRVVKTLNQIDRLTANGAAWADVEAVADQREEDRLALWAKVSRLERRLRALRARLAAAIGEQPTAALALRTNLHSDHADDRA